MLITVSRAENEESKDRKRNVKCKQKEKDSFFDLRVDTEPQKQNTKVKAKTEDAKAETPDIYGQVLIKFVEFPKIEKLFNIDVVEKPVKRRIGRNNYSRDL